MYNNVADGDHNACKKVKRVVLVDNGQKQSVTLPCDNLLQSTIFIQYCF